MKKLVVLLAEDNSVTRAMYVFFMNQIAEEKKDQAKILFALAEDGQEAYDHLSPMIDLLITDCRMPKMDGIELTKKAKERFPRLPVVMMSSEDGEMQKKAEEAGVAFFVSKEFANKKTFDGLLHYFITKSPP